MRLTDVIQLAAAQGARRHYEKRAAVLPLVLGASLPGIVERAAERARSAEEAMAGPQPRLKAANMAWAGKPKNPFGTDDVSRFAFPGTSPRETANFGRFNPDAAITPPTPSLMEALMGGAAKPLGASAMSVATSPLDGVAKGMSGGIAGLIQKKLFGQELGERQDAVGLAGSAALKAFGSEVGKSSVGLLRDIAMKAMDAVGQRGDNAAREAILGELKKTDSVLSQADDALLMESYHTMCRFAPTLSTDKNAVRSFLRQAVMSGAGPDFMTIKHLADSERAITGGGEKRGAALRAGSL